METKVLETGRYQTYFTFVGFNPNQEICKYSFDVVSQKLKKERKAYMKSIEHERERGKSKRADAFAMGWGTAVLNKVVKLVPEKEIPKTQGTNTKALMAIDLINQYIENSTESPVKMNKSDWDNNRADVLNGMEAGNKVEIHKGVDVREHSMIEGTKKATKL